MRPRPLLILTVFLMTAALTACGPTKEGLKARADARDRLDVFSAQFTYDQAMQDFRAAQFDRALSTIGRAIEQQPDTPQFELLRGRIYLEMHRLERALDSFTAALALDGEYAEAHYFAGIVHQRWSDDAQAHEHYARAYEIESDNVQYLLATAESLVALSEFDQARRIVEDKLAYFEHNFAMRHLLGQIALLQDDPATAAQYYGEARLLDPENTTLLEELARAQYEAGQYGQCLETVGLLTDRLSQRRPELMHLEAKCLVGLERLTDAHNRYFELTRLDASSASIWIEFGTVAWELGDLPRVGLCGVRATGLAPERWEGYLLKGLFERHHGRHDEAARLFRDAAERAEDTVLPRLLLGQTLEALGEDREALAVYSGAIELDPTCREARSLLTALQRRIQVAAAAEPARE